jgi:hypothetical protein
MWIHVWKLVRAHAKATLTGMVRHFLSMRSLKEKEVQLVDAAYPRDLKQRRR